MYRAYKQHRMPLGYIHLTNCPKKPIKQCTLFSAYALTLNYNICPQRYAQEMK